ncbi:MAG: nucleotide exchange factor GrpE [Spirochaetaceae bacterium]|nr:nucleotide exchange factor GrpE [Spirochaetaceae bacterium]
MNKKQETDVQQQDAQQYLAEEEPIQSAQDVQQECEEEQTSEQKISQLEKVVEDLKKANAELQDQYLRKVADFDNYRKRMIKEKQDAFDYANTNLLSDLLESLDNFDRALEASSNATDVQSVVQGVQMTKDKLVSMLENKYNLVGYGQKGDIFDPNIHEAIASVPGPVAEALCSEVYLRGYKLKERVIRHAKVMVQMPDGSVSSENEDSSDGADVE